MKLNLRFILGLFVYGLFLPAPVLRPELHAQAGECVTARSETDGVARITYQWTDPNSYKILGWKGDTRIIDPAVAPQSLRFTGEILKNRLSGAIDSFGIPASMMAYSYRDAEDKRQKEEQIRNQMEARGMTFSEEERTVRIRYDWVVAKSRDDLKEVAAGLMRAGTECRYSGTRDLVSVLSSFVQNFKYRIPGQYRANDKGERILTGGVTMPLETLYNGWGDCDTKSLLFASLLSTIPKTSVVFLVGNRHTFVGIRGTPRPGDRYVSIRNIPYILVEMTTPWPLGRVPTSHWQALGARQLRIVPVYDND